MNMLTPDDVVLADLRDGEKAYPIYRVKARWTQAIVNERRFAAVASRTACRRVACGIVRTGT